MGWGRDAKRRASAFEICRIKRLCFRTLGTPDLQLLTLLGQGGVHSTSYSTWLAVLLSTHWLPVPGGKQGRAEAQLLVSCGNQAGMEVSQALQVDLREGVNTMNNTYPTSQLSHHPLRIIHISVKCPWTG